MGLTALPRTRLVKHVGRSKALDWIRSGALTAGVATLLAVVCKGLDRLGYFTWPSGFDLSFLAIIAVSVTLGATLGQRAPADAAAAPRARIARALLAAVIAFVIASIIGAGLLGLAFVLVKWTPLAERDLPPVFVVLGVALVAAGVRRAPRHPAVTIVLALAVVLLASVRLLASFPQGARALEKRLFPLPPAAVRAAWDQQRCGASCADGRTRVVDFTHRTGYAVEDHAPLLADVEVRATLEVSKPYFTDGCGDARGTRPEVPASVRPYPSTAACISARPRPRYDWRSPGYDLDCCSIDVRRHQQGERFTVTRRMRFAFARLRWTLVGDSPRPPHPRPQRRVDP